MLLPHLTDIVNDEILRKHNSKVGE